MSSEPRLAQSGASPASVEVRSSETDLARVRLQQERELKERELALKERELDIQGQQTRWNRWSTPTFVAVIGGLLGYFGTLISSYQSRQLERDKQEATLLLEAIRTAGTGSEREQQTAANLVFFADAGLITSLKPSELDKLRVKARGAVPSLPSPQVQGVEFRRSSGLTAERQSRLQMALVEFQAFLRRTGYKPDSSEAQVAVRVDEETRDNAYFDGSKGEVVIGASLADDPEYVLSEYTWHVLKQSNPSIFEAVGANQGAPLEGFAYGLKFYLTASYANDPAIGKNYYALVGQGSAAGGTGPLFRLDRVRALDNADPGGLEPHQVGEVWGGALWELRGQLGPETADRVALAAWTALQPRVGRQDQIRRYVDGVVAAVKSSGSAATEASVRAPFVRRNLN